MLTLTQQMILGKQNKTKKEVSLPPQLLNLENALDLKTFSWMQNALWMVIQREWQDDPKDHVKLLSYNTDSERWATVYYKRLNQAKAGWTCRRLLPTFGGFVVEKIERLAITTDG